MMETPVFKLVSSLGKVFADAEPDSCPLQEGSVFQNESFSFQVAYTGGATRENRGRSAVVSLDCAPEDRSRITIRQVGLVPSQFPAYADHDENYLRDTPGLFPDPLLPLENPVRLLENQWRALWVEFTPDAGTQPGAHTFTIRFADSESGDEVGSVTQSVTVLPGLLPEQALIHTEWFHADCLCDFYGADAFSEEHWSLIEAFAQAAVRRGINMLLTPIFTPPLDTAVGGERTTVQLVGVARTDAGYSFDFSRLVRWMQLCRRVGVRYLEISHLFTQWGANCTSKVMAQVNGKEQRIFGWDVPAQSPQYREFLDALLPELTQLLREEWGAGKVFFHVSDEPHLTHLENYKAAKALIAPYLEGFTIIDALSDYDFYRTGALEHPIPASNHIGPFLENQVPNLWTYYCCGQGNDVSNRFMSMPSARNRILGVQLYLYDIKGFLQWGYNFWNTQFSKKHIDPYAVTDAGLAFPSGDAFLVYPGQDGAPVESIRMLVFQEALQDLRALRLLESLTSRQAVVELIGSLTDTPITFTQYPKEDGWLFAMRRKVNEAIRAAQA